MMSFLLGFGKKNAIAGYTSGFVKEPIVFTAIILLVVLTFLIGFSLLWNINNIRHEKIQLAIAEARANWNKDQAFRGWATKHGGVYVKPDERTPPSPYLAHISKRDVVTTDGMKLTLMNPAYMMRQMTHEYEKTYGIKGSITGKILLNPVNEPDEWERKVLDMYDANPAEVIEQANIDNEPYIRLMKPMVMKQGCVKCHGHLGFKVGDVRGGVSVSIPLTRYFLAADSTIRSMKITHFVIWILGCIGIILFVITGRKRESERQYLQSELEKSHSLLEQRVEERTRELQIKEVELLKSQARELYANKMASLGQMASGMAHEINSPLQSINLVAHKIRTQIKKQEYGFVPESLSVIEKSVNKITTMIESLRKISRDSHQDSLEWLKIENIVKDVTCITNERFSLSEIDFDIEYHNDVDQYEIYCQPIQIEQIIMNLLNNAFDAVEKTDSKWIRLQVSDLGDIIQFAVSDSGKGVPEEIRDRIFEPLFTSKDIGQGTGIGLSISFEIAEKHGGKLYLDDASANTRFVLELPKKIS